MSRVVAVPNWSLYDPSLCDRARQLLESRGLRVHYCQGDVDHQRSVTAFSGADSDVFESALALAELILPNIDLQLQKGVHPRVGALDVMPFVLLEGNEEQLIADTVRWAEEFSSRFDLPVHLYEKAARPGMESRLPYLRGQFGPVEKQPDFAGQPNLRWGTSIVGVRDFLLAANINLSTPDVRVARLLAKEIRTLRENGVPAFAGVRALGFPLASRSMSQLSLNFTLPNQTRFDDVYEFVSSRSGELGLRHLETELIGVIRQADAAKARHLKFESSQLVD